MKAKRIVVSGRVQGVGYRYYTQRAATSLGINGYVRNLPQGGVEVIVQLGGNEDFAAFLEALKAGPRQAHVTGVEVMPYSGEAGEFASFEIRG